MIEKLFILIVLLGSSLLTAAVLYGLAKRGRNLSRFRERQQFYSDLHRFSVTIVTTFALYLLYTRVPLWAILPLPDAIPLFATTVFPMLALCLLAGRWYVGCTAALLLQWFVLAVNDQAHFFLQNAVLSLIGLGLYLLHHLSSRSAKKRQHEFLRLIRALRLKKQAS
ncbi:hypothetical protein CIG75_17375 [Tumebacillus algifaecis]|uniref:Uncharacterized protein n=1 Tax=Tumebacillus algifaecis TaxID=1214604 RepID=A0A223D4L2_9BACL|nr:hypothetical protein [Tumebacillus algifaecis]ASS76558.1 hypothetical protein CIG75_17375 [Tumebacillus algifaecis]